MDGRKERKRERERVEVMSDQVGKLTFGRLGLAIQLPFCYLSTLIFPTRNLSSCL